MLKLLFTLFILNILIHVSSKKNIEEKFPSEGNPNFVRDRSKNLINKPELPPTYADHYKAPFNPAWMDYCDPYHCNDYWRQACGLNRKKMKFKFFQSACHLMLHNQCANFRGALKYDLVEVKHCRVYVMFPRSGCPRECHNEPIAPICAMSSTKGHTVLFLNECSVDLVNCKNATLHEYEPVNMRMCEYFLRLKSQNIDNK